MLPVSRHRIRKKGTQRIERQNLNFRTHIKRLNRRTICFSKSEIMHDAVIKLFIYRTNTKKLHFQDTTVSFVRHPFHALHTNFPRLSMMICRISCLVSHSCFSANFFFGGSACIYRRSHHRKRPCRSNFLFASDSNVLLPSTA